MRFCADIAVGKIDSIDLFTWSDAFTPPKRTEYFAPVELWYRFLNTNARLPTTAGTDKMRNVQVVGSVRTYAYIRDSFSYHAWLDAIKAGRTFVSTGPVVRLTANGSPIGSDLMLSKGTKVLLEANVDAPYEHYPVERLEIVVGGKVVANRANDAQALHLVLKAEVVRNPVPGWLLVLTGVNCCLIRCGSLVALSEFPRWLTPVPSILQSMVNRSGPPRLLPQEQIWWDYS